MTVYKFKNLVLILSASHVLGIAAAQKNDSPVTTLKPTVRLVYNRVGKAGSTTMCQVIRMQSDKLNFRAIGPYASKTGQSWFHPEVTINDLRAVQDGEVWINHAPFVAHGLQDSRYVWINVVREPFDRAQSIYYYAVDPVARLPKAAELTMKQRLADPRCGCAQLEFSECIVMRKERGCRLLPDSQLMFFCETGMACGLANATRNADEYAFIGLTSEFHLTLRILEKILPSWFAGAPELQIPHSRSGSWENNMTGTTQLGAITKRAKGLLQKDPHFSDELAFYEHCQRKFWLAAVRLFGDELLS